MADVADKALQAVPAAPPGGPADFGPVRASDAAAVHAPVFGAVAGAVVLAGCATSPTGIGGLAAPQSGQAAALTPAQASRFLAQAAFGATPESIARVQAIGPAAWIDEQMALPRSQGHVDWLHENDYAHERFRNTVQGTENTLWRKLIGSPDALRQRVTWALSEIFVISIPGLPVAWRPFVAAHYMDLLEAHAFGRYRELLGAVTLSPAMGVYLNMRGNRKADPATGRLPDENYAREVLQLFSIGLLELRPDGRLRTDWRGRPIETYNQETVAGLARVFTGWNLDRFDRNRQDWACRPMAFNRAQHEPGEKRFLGHTIAAGTPGPQALEEALDVIAAHPNVGPFIGRQLIQRLVTSNPSPAYVRRVAQAFADNGQGVRGDLAAVVRAVLLDEEARRDPAADERQAGRLREPIERFVQWARSFGATSNNGKWAIGLTTDAATRLGQSPLRAPSVFNFFRPGYLPPNSELASRGLQAPEFQLVHESSVVAWVNFAQQFVGAGVADVKTDYARELPLAGDAQALVAHVELLLAAGALSGAARQLITQAVQSMPAQTPAQQRARVQAAVHLVLCSPDYLVAV
ncbi:MAG: DUF1800 family protein [Burkholderiales bacterium]|nr:DUF1800 family protein [Burkholderiales bacterium]